MAAPNSSAEPTFRLADRLAEARRGRFVGREAELALFRSALLAEQPPFAVLHLYGPGGVGKTTLLREYVRLAEERGRAVVRLDGRNIRPSPAEFLWSLGRVMGLEETAATSTVPNWPPDSVLIIDTYETLAPLDVWLRDTLLPQLPGHSLVVIAGRNPPSPTWRTDVDWADLTRIVSLRNLRPEESQTYLAARGIPDERHAGVLALTHGHPLALSLVAEIMAQSDAPATFHLQNDPDTVRILLERFVRDVPGPQYRLALEACAVARATTEALLAEVLSDTDVPALFAWLRGLSFIEVGPYGLFPHDLAREVLEADLRWRNPDRYQQLLRHVRAYLQARFQQTSGAEQQRVRLEILYVNRHSPILKTFFDWTGFDSAYSEPAAAQDHAAIVDMVRRHEGDASADLAGYWLDRQPQAFLAYRGQQSELLGFCANLALHEVSPADIATDPAVAAVLDFARRYGPTRPGEEMAFLRFWMGQQTYQAVSPFLNLTAVSNTTYWVTHPKLAWTFLSMADPDFMQPHFTGISFQRSPEADFEVGGRRYGIFSHDWRVEPAAAWQNNIADRYSKSDFKPDQPQNPSPPPLLVLSQTEFEEAVRQALRDYTRPDLLAANPLMRSRLVVEAAAPPAVPATLQTLLQEAAATLTGNPKDEKLYRAIHHTYLDPAPTQEQAAEQLNLPFNTYRYHLANGLKRIAEWLWQRELQDFSR